MIDSYSDSDDIIINSINEFSSKLVVDRAKMVLNEKLQFVMDEPHYNEGKQIIYMDENEDDYEYAETWKHEVGHFIDHQMGWVSHSEEFAVAKGLDIELLKEGTGIEKAAKMLEELQNSPALDNRYLSDILSGLFYNQPRIRTAIEVTYDHLGVAMYGHDDKYWSEVEGPKKAVEGEVFADLFAIYTENNPSTINFIEKWFPNITSGFKKELGN